jgi:hypothetical protein
MDAYVQKAGNQIRLVNVHYATSVGKMTDKVVDVIYVIVDTAVQRVPLIIVYMVRLPLTRINRHVFVLPVGRKIVMEYVHCVLVATEGQLVPLIIVYMVLLLLTLIILDAVVLPVGRKIVMEYVRYAQVAIQEPIATNV